MNTPLSVCIVVNDLFRGGAQRIIADIVTHIDRSQYAVDVVFFNAPAEGSVDDTLKDELLTAGATVSYIGGMGKGLGNFVRLFKHLQKTRPMVVQTFLPYASILGRIAGFLVGARVVSAQCNLPFTYPLTLRLLDALTLPLTAAWTGTTNGIEAAYGGDSKSFDISLWNTGRRHFTIYGGVEVDKIREQAKNVDNDAIRIDLGIPPGAPLFLMVARLISWKGHTDLIMAMKYLKDAHLLLVGWGPLEEELKALAKKEEVESRVHFLGRRSDVYQLLGAVDCYVQAHQRESDGSVWMGPNLSQIEACAAGVASVSTAVPLIEELIEDRVSGRLANCNDPMDLARVLKEVVATSSDERMGYVTQAMGRVRTHYSVRAMVNAYQGIYEALVTRPPIF